MHRFERCQSTESIWEEPERGTFFRTTLRSTQQPMRRISWAASLCLPLPVDKYLAFYLDRFIHACMCVAVTDAHKMPKHVLHAPLRQIRKRVGGNALRLELLQLWACGLHSTAQAFTLIGTGVGLQQLEAV